MSYDYQALREQVFTDEGQRMYIQLRDHTRDLMSKAGCAQLCKMIEPLTGDSWLMLACVDRMVELLDIDCVYTGHATQFNIYVPTRKFIP